MKKLVITTLIAFIFISTLHAQVQDPVKWNYSAVKKTDKEYAVTISATISPNWHIYSMTTPDGGPVATTFNFNRNPLITLAGKPQENGKPQTIFDDIVSKNEDWWVYYDESKKLAGNTKTKFLLNSFLVYALIMIIEMD